MNEERVVNQRKGHRAYVTKIINKVNGLLVSYSKENDNQLTSYRESLREKSYILKGLNDEILALPDDEKQIEDEIVRSSEIDDEIKEVILSIDAKINTQSKPIGFSTNSFSMLSNASNAKLPKLSLMNFFSK